MSDTTLQYGNGGLSYSPSQRLLRHWRILLVTGTIGLCILLWFQLPIWAPAIVIRYSPWDGPYCRAVLTHYGYEHLGDANVLAAEKGIRLDRLYRQAMHDPDAAVHLFALSTQLGLDGGAAEEYSSMVQSVVESYPEDQAIAALDRLDPAAVQEILRYIAFETGAFEESPTTFQTFKATYPKLAARLQHEFQH